MHKKKKKKNKAILGTYAASIKVYIFMSHILQMTFLLSVFKQLSISNLHAVFWYCAVR